MLFAVFPRALVIAFDDHMDALNHVPVSITLEGDDAFEAQDVGSLGLCELVNPREEFFRLHLAAAQRYGGDGHIMDRRGWRMVVVVVVVMMVIMIVMIVGMMVMMVMIMMVMAAVFVVHMVMVMIVVVRVEEMRVVFEHTLQVESAAVEHFIQVYV